jgi:hypothetical protein
MEMKVRQSGFSLMETLLAVGTLAVGLLFVGGTFMTGVYFSTVSTERTVASVAAEEAFAKIRLYDPNLNVNSLSAAGFTRYDLIGTAPATEFLYPSIGQVFARQYSWSALCRRDSADLNSRLVRVVVFVCRQGGANSRFWMHETGGFVQSDLPRPVRVTIAQDTGSPTNEVRVVDAVTVDPVTRDVIDPRTFISDGASIVDDATGQIYRVLERLPDRPDTIRLDRDWAGNPITVDEPGGVWVVPHPVSGGRNPLVGIYQRVFRF